MRKLGCLLFLLGSWTLSSSAMASEGNSGKSEGVVHGYVVDASTKKPVAGVIVSASTGKNKVNKEVSTDASGYFKLQQVPAGDLSLQFEKKGYRNVKKDAVQLKSGQVIKVNVDMPVEKAGMEPMHEFEHPILRLVDGII
ncbi:carboxypeptidase-like regulatory domain-containing protein [Flavihumibacter rivuli]|uniref:carboxypeptidase-like regulatory domain-containing protein n=1 Tax=Flavihumibacter rivuli TaxID=2838156 RepID=UPI001BDEAA6E|nr:carboxypeptidase-like regulatory domain-containing protein [Flavihumibacter rivuli]ULQ56579.1 carboxypeptidase-like regulatory domain-containing protein [Flavihumibacter rivuli]